MATSNNKVPTKQPIFEALGFIPEGQAGEEVYGTCPFCNKEKKFYLNPTTGQYSCKVGSCDRRGNVYTFLTDWYEDNLEDQTAPWEALAENRKLPLEVVLEAGLAWDGERFALPTRSLKGGIVNLRFFRIGEKLKGLPTLDVVPWNFDAVANDKRRKEPVYICEGEWDAIALQYFLQTNEVPGVAIGMPGATIFKDSWVEAFANRKVVLCYDNDEAGFKGQNRAKFKLKNFTQDVSILDWPDTLPEGWDVRDFVSKGGTLDDLRDLTRPFKDKVKAGREGATEEDRQQADERDTLPLLSVGSRPSFEETLKAYKQHLRFNPEMEWALRVIYALIISTWLDGEPLWMHIVCPPGGGKTELLMSCKDAVLCVARSTVSPHSLVSGYQMSGGADPSLLPLLSGRTLIVKDWTEILGMPKTNKEEVLSILRGAYDGQVEKQFGNGIFRNYQDSYFNMITGVTHAIHGENRTSLGERFLLFKLPPPKDAFQTISRALDNAGGESEMKAELCAAAKAFLDFKITPEDTPIEIPEQFKTELIYLAQMTSMLRTSVEKDYARDRLRYRPENEVATRLAKQFYKLLRGLALVRWPNPVTEEDMEIVRHVALSSCSAWNLEIVQELAQESGLLVDELVERTGIPRTTILEHLDEMRIVGVLSREEVLREGVRGMRPYRYFLSDTFQEYWNGAGLKSAPRRAADKPKQLTVPKGLKRKAKEG